jgi:subtilisin family serine protease
MRTPGTLSGCPPHEGQSSMNQSPRHGGRRLACLFTAVCLSGMHVGITSAAQRSSTPRQTIMPEAVPDELLVQFKPGVREGRRAATRAAHRVAVLRRFDALGIEHVRLPKGAHPRGVAEALRANTDVWNAQPNYIRRVSASAPPNDTFWRDESMWGMQKISADSAWNIFGGGSTTVVLANIDTGVNYNHPDLAANMWKNPGELPGNGVDDDENGYIDDVYGIDTANGDSDPFDDHGHGTHTSGTAAAVANNNVGVVGVSWNVRILPCKFMDASGSGTDAGAIACFNYVVDQKARGVNVRVTSNSWGGPRSGEVATVLKNAIDAAGDAGIINVFAAGNSGTDNNVEPVDPASFTSPSIVAVAATDEYFPDTRAFWSNYGTTSVDLAAPGTNILSTYDDWYAYLSGTSMAAAHVAGAAALLFSHAPALTVWEAKDALMNNVDVLVDWNGLAASGGRLNVFQALVSLTNNAMPTVALTSPGDAETFTAVAMIPLAATANDSDGTIAQVDFYAGPALLGSDTTAPYEFSWTNVPPGSYTLTAVATDNSSATTRSAPVGVTVQAAPSATPFTGTLISVPGTIEAEDFDHGDAGASYFDLTAGNTGGEYRATDVDIEATSDTGGGYNVGWMDAGEWLQYTVSVAAAGTYTLEARVASVADGATFHIEMNGVDITGPLTIPNSGGWQDWQTLTTTVMLEAGVQPLRIVLDSSAWSGVVGNFNYLRLWQSEVNTPSQNADNQQTGCCDDDFPSQQHQGSPK